MRGDVTEGGGAEVGPGIGDGVIGEDFSPEAGVGVAELVVAEERAAVVTADDEDVGRSPGDGGRGYDGVGRAGDFGPAFTGSVAVAVAEETAGGGATGWEELGAAEEVDGAVLGGCRG